MYAAETSCALPKKALTQRGRDSGDSRRPPKRRRPAISEYSSTMIATPRVKPAIGELIIGTSTFQSRPPFLVQLPISCDQISALQSLCAAASAAPHSPPISACEDDDGRPSHQVIRFQVMPPPSAHSRTCEVTFTTSVSTRPEEMVLATAVPMNAPIRFMVAARITAWPGESTFVATTVAMELAVSWKPLMNSNTRAASTTTRTRASIESMRQGLAVLQRDFIGDHAGLAAAVDRLFEDLEELLEQEHLRGFHAPGIDVPVQLQDQAVGLVLEHAQLVAELLHRLQAQVRQLLHHSHRRRGGLLQHRRARGEVDPLQALASQGIA